jgi:hypothetical protein
MNPLILPQPRATGDYEVREEDSTVFIYLLFPFSHFLPFCLLPFVNCLLLLFHLFTHRIFSEGGPSNF